jgi:hypothetical protein
MQAAAAKAAPMSTPQLAIVPATDPAAPALPAVPAVPVSTGASYDVLAIVDAMEAQGIDAGVMGAVCNAIGHLGTCTLDILKTCDVPALKVFAARKALDAARAVTGMSQVTLFYFDDLLRGWSTVEFIALVDIAGCCCAFFVVAGGARCRCSHGST